MTQSTSCILVVGSTGTGKSTLIGLCTGVPVSTSGGTSECTLDIKEFKEKGNESGPVWIDSVGFDGTDSKRSDEEAFQYILKFLQEKKISHVAGIIWTVNPDDREAAKLQEQAKLINKFKEGVVWNNVIIAVKKTRGNARKDGAGALAAAGRYCNKDSVRAIGYALLEQLDENERPFWKEQTQTNRMKMGIMTEAEAKVLIKDKLKMLPPLFQVVFRNNKCVDCGVMCDSRLLPLVCHVIKEQVHPAMPEPFHPLTAVLKHPVTEPKLVHVGTVETSEHKEGQSGSDGLATGLGIATGIITSSFIPVLGVLPALFGGGSVTIKVVSMWSCCGKSVDSEGCESQFPCCAQPVSSPGCQEVNQCCSSLSKANPGCARRFPCCSQQEGATGCTEQCSYCKVAWGKFDNKKGCIGRSHNNVIRI